MPTISAAQRPMRSDRRTRRGCRGRKGDTTRTDPHAAPEPQNQTERRPPPGPRRGGAKPADQGQIGRLGALAVAAVALSHLILFAGFVIGMGLVSAVASLAAQAYG